MMVYVYAPKSALKPFEGLSTGGCFEVGAQPRSLSADTGSPQYGGVSPAMSRHPGLTSKMAARRRTASALKA